MRFCADGEYCAINGDGDEFCAVKLGRGGIKMDKRCGVVLQEFEEGFFFCPDIEIRGAALEGEFFVFGEEAGRTIPKSLRGSSLYTRRDIFRLLFVI